MTRFDVWAPLPQRVRLSLGGRQNPTVMEMRRVDDGFCALVSR